MKILSEVDTLRAEDTIISHSPQSAVKVCIHVVRAARTDVRAMRAASALVEAGYAVSIVDIESESARSFERNIGGIQMEHILIPDWHRSRGFELWFFVKAAQAFLLSILKLVQVQADIYHASEVTALPASYIAAKLRRKPLLFEAYELPLEDVPLSEMGIVRRYFHKLLAVLLAFMIPQCAAVITVSPPIVQEIRKRYHISRVALVRNILPYKKVAKSDRLREYLGLHPGVRIALYQGNLQPDRGLETLVHAAEFLEQDIVIVMMGKGIGTTQSRLEALISSKGVADHVKILSSAPYEELLDWTSSADIGLTLIPLDYTLNMKLCLPNKLFEYLMAGLPVLSAPLESVAEIIHAYDVGRVVSSLDPQDVAAAMNAMLKDSAALASMENNARKAAEELCWEKESRELIGLYRDVLKGLVQNETTV